MCRVADYWPRIKRVPLHVDRETDDGEAVICRAQDGTPVRVTKPELFSSDEKREAAISLLEGFYSPRSIGH